jgi:hypothetical protein
VGEDFPGPDVERDVVDRPDFLERFDDVLDADDRMIAHDFGAAGLAA